MLYFITRLIGFTGLILGGIRVSLGGYVASFYDPAQRLALAKRYLGSSSSGDAIDQGIIWMVVGLGFFIAAKLLKR
jgi:hypothetical protein